MFYEEEMLQNVAKLVGWEKSTQIQTCTNRDEPFHTTEPTRNCSECNHMNGFFPYEPYNPSKAQAEEAKEDDVQSHGRGM